MIKMVVFPIFFIATLFVVFVDVGLSNIIIIGMVLISFLSIPLIPIFYSHIKSKEKVIQEIQYYYKSDNFKILEYIGDHTITIKVINPDGKREILEKRDNVSLSDFNTIAKIERALNEYYNSPHFSILSCERQIANAEKSYMAGYIVKVKNHNRQIETIYLEHM